MANTQMTYLIFERNADRVGRLLRSTPYYDQYKYATAAILLCHKDGKQPADQLLETYLPAELLEEHLAASGEFPLIDTDKTSFTYLHWLYDARGISTADWSTAFGSLDESSGSRFAVSNLDSQPYLNVSSSYSESFFAYQSLKGDPDLNLESLGADKIEIKNSPSIHSGELLFPKKFFRFKNPSSGFCDDLAAKSQAAFKELLKTISAADIVATSREAKPSRSGLEILQICASCHDGSIAPARPYEDTAALRTLLTKSPRLLTKIESRVRSEKDSTVMPPSGDLSAEEKDRFMQMLRSLVGK
jgi:hypothetical protein